VLTGGFAGAGGVSTGGVGGGTSGGAGGATPEQCVSQARSDCEACACKGCFQQLVPCFQDEACPLILQCANQTHCTGTDCLNPDTCGPLIQKYGIGSPGVSLAVSLFGCIANTGCDCGFGGLQ
jgi:hypothetical protein